MIIRVNKEPPKPKAKPRQSTGTKKVIRKTESPVLPKEEEKKEDKE